MAEGAAATKGISAGDRVAAGVVTFARRALANPRLAWALLAEPVDPAVEAERLHFRHSYRDVLSEVIADGVGSGELPEQDPEATAAALVGAIGEAMVGPLSPADRSDPEAAIESLVNFCIRAIGKEAHVNA
jgi:AcrR family transcriptional regulator